MNRVGASVPLLSPQLRRDMQPGALQGDTRRDRRCAQIAPFLTAQIDPVKREVAWFDHVAPHLHGPRFTEIRHDDTVLPFRPHPELAHRRLVVRVAETAAQAGQSNPSVVVQGPSRTESAGTSKSAPVPSQEQKDGEGDVKMVDSDPVPTAKVEPVAPVARRDETANRPVFPPPPSVPPPAPTEEVASPEPAEQKQQWLLPPIAPKFQGKKCLVLDLDETLVHSSFKVCLVESICLITR